MVGFLPDAVVEQHHPAVLVSAALDERFRWRSCRRNNRLSSFRDAFLRYCITVCTLSCGRKMPGHVSICPYFKYCCEHLSGDQFSCEHLSCEHMSAHLILYTLCETRITRCICFHYATNIVLWIGLEMIGVPSAARLPQVENVIVECRWPNQ